MKTQPVLCISAPVLSLLLLASCDTIRSVPAPVNDTPETVLGSDKSSKYYFLPQTRLHLVGTPSPASKEGEPPVAYQVTITTETSPDRSRRYLAQHLTNVFAHDTIKLSVENELLHGEQTIQSKDELPSILVSLGKSAVYAWDIYSSLNPTNPIADTSGLSPFDVTFNPFDEAEVKDAQTALSAIAFDLKVEADNVTTLREPKKGRDGGNSGFYYRPPTTVTVSLNYNDATKLAFKRHQTIAVPNPGEVAVLPVRRVPMVDSKLKPSFDAGSPNKLDIDRPSPVLSVIEIPEKILAAAAGAIGGIFDNRAKGRTDIKDSALLEAQIAQAKAEAEKARVEAQRDALKAQKEALEAEAALEKAKKKAQPDPGAQ